MKLIEKKWISHIFSKFGGYKNPPDDILKRIIKNSDWKYTEYEEIVGMDFFLIIFGNYFFSVLEFDCT